MGTTMDNPECEWVRVRLPLCVGISDDPTERGGEGGDLSPEDCRSIERHLGSCPACAEHQAGLEPHLATLGLAADALVAAPEAPSLWPALKQRIEAHHAPNRPRWLRAVHGVSDRGSRAWTAFDSERPLRMAWMRDSLSEVLKGTGLGEATPRGQSGRRRWVRRTAWVMGTSVAAALLALVIGLPVAQRQQESAQSVISANARPLPGAVVPPLPVEAKTPAIADSANEPDTPASELAQADPTPAPEPPATEAAPASKSAPATGTATATANPAPAPSRWNYDLEHGTPMPSYARDAKPVY